MTSGYSENVDNTKTNSNVRRRTSSNTRRQEDVSRQQESHGSGTRVRFNIAPSPRLDGLSGSGLHLSDQNDLETDSEDEFDLATPNLERQNARENESPGASHEIDLEPGPVDHTRKLNHGLLSLLLRLQNAAGKDKSLSPTPALTPSTSPPMSRGASGASTPLQRSGPASFGHSRNESTSSLSALLRSVVPTPSSNDSSTSGLELLHGVNERLKRLDQSAGSAVKARSSAIAAKKRSSRQAAEQRRLKKLMTETSERQRYTEKLCRALLRYGAPSHRLEAYMRTIAADLSIAGEFQHTPGCMHITYSDPETFTSQTKFIRENDGVDLGRLDSVHNIYKRVSTGDALVSQGLEALEELMSRKQKFPNWALVIAYGFGSATVGPFAFQARPVDIPIAFLLGALVGFLQYYANPVSELWASLFPILATISTSILARLFGAIEFHGNPLFCFSALVQSSIALILPGYTVLRSALEIQAGQTSAGAARLVSGLFTTVLQAFGITLGTAIVGAILPDSPAAATCPSKPLDFRWNFLFVPCFALCLIVINQAKFRQIPAAMLVALAGYHVTFWTSRNIPGPFLGNAAGGLTVGLLANGYSRFGYRWQQALVGFYHRHRPQLPTNTKDAVAPERPTYGLAVATMLPAIWVQVPSGIAAFGSLASGIASAAEITNRKSSGASQGPQGDVDALLPVLAVGLSVVQFAVGLAGGLQIGTLIVYIRGKKSGGVFSM